MFNTCKIRKKKGIVHQENADTSKNQTPGAKAPGVLHFSILNNFQVISALFSVPEYTNVLRYLLFEHLA